MKRIISFIKELPTKTKIKYTVIASCIILAVVLQVIGGNIKSELPDEQVANAWDKDGGYTQISAYLSGGSVTEEDKYQEICYNLQTALKEESIEPTSEKSRLMIGAYSGAGNVSLTRNGTSVTVNALGVGGDFFQFHPIDLVDGTTFNDDFLMQDYIIIDPETAWALFGSNYVAGMTVTINDIPFIVAGVYEPTDAYLAKEAGLDQSLVFMFYSSLKTYGSVEGIDSMEFLMPNPVSGYALKTVTEKAGLDAGKSVIVETSERFSMENLYKVALSYGERSMSKRSIVYPYWENMARGYEDILSFMLIIKTILWSVVVILLWISLRPIKHLKQGLQFVKRKIKGRKWNEKK